MNSFHPLVSIIIPFYNAARFLAETIESVLGQTFRNWELLLVDDGSFDESTLIARQYAAQRPAQIFYINHADQSNHGAAIARNLGIKNARGELIALLDSDDTWFPNKLDEQVALLRQHPAAAMVFGLSEYWHSWAGAVANSQKDSVPSLVPQGLYQPPELLKITYPICPSGGAAPPSNVLIRRSAITSVSGFPEEFAGRAFEDIAFYAKLFVHFPVYVSDRCWDRYRVHPWSFTANMGRTEGAHLEAREFYWVWLGKYLTQCGVSDPTLWRVYRRKTWRNRHPTIAEAIRTARRYARPVKRVIKRLRSS